MKKRRLQVATGILLFLILIVFSCKVRDQASKEKYLPKMKQPREAVSSDRGESIPKTQESLPAPPPPPSPGSSPRQRAKPRPEFSERMENPPVNAERMSEDQNDVAFKAEPRKEKHMQYAERIDQSSSEPAVKVRSVKDVNKVTPVVYPKTSSKSIAFYCPEEMKEENTYEVRAMLGYFLKDEQVKDELLGAINETRKEMHEAPVTLSDIATKAIALDKYVKIDLLDPANKFKIVFVPINPNSPTNEPVKIFDDATNQYYPNLFKWIWKVTPNTSSKGPAVLTLVITPYDKDRKPQTGEQRNYAIKVALKESFVAAVWDRANRNPEWAVASIITPILSFFAGLFVKKKKKNSDTNNPDA